MEKNLQNSQSQEAQQVQTQINQGTLQKSIKIVLFALGGLILISGAFYVGMLFGVKRSTRELMQLLSTPSVSETQSTKFPTVQPTLPPISQPVGGTEGWRTYKNERDGFLISYPPEWSFGESQYDACLGSDQKYVDLYCYGKNNIELPKIGFKTTRLGVDRDIVPPGMSQGEALKQEYGRGALPLIDETYLTINGVSAYRALRQIKKGESGLGDDIFKITRTDVEYSFLKDDDLYRIWFELDNNEPEEYITMFDKVAQTFKFISD